MKTLSLLVVLAAGLSAQTVQQNIDSACTQILGAACSNNSTLYSTYSAIVTQINAKKLQSDPTSIMYNYLLPMIKANPGWQLNLVDWAWKAAACPGSPQESQWQQAYTQGKWQTYPQLYNLLKGAGCGATKAAPATAAAQYVPAAQMTSGYQTVWGAAWNSPPVQMMTTCPVSTGAVSCARSALAGYINSSRNNTAILATLAAPVFVRVIGANPNTNQIATVEGVYGRYWTGADDLATYLANTKSSWVVSTLQTYTATTSTATTTTVALRMLSDGSLVDGTGRALPNTKGSYYLSVVNGQIVAAGGGNYVAWVRGQSGNVAVVVKPGAASGVLVDNYSSPYRIVAAGGGNFQVSNTYGAVAVGGSNIIAAGGGNIVAAGGGNIILNGGGNIALPPAQALAQTVAKVVSNDGGSLISQDGSSLNVVTLAKLAPTIH